jgi:RecQ family ATP-dependent DNA helicase
MALPQTPQNKTVFFWTLIALLDELVTSVVSAFYNIRLFHSSIVCHHTHKHFTMSSSSSDFKTRAEAVLKQYWGYESFRSSQLEAIEATCVDKRDVFALMCTGAGKSLIYQVPSLVTGTTTIVISPLISLMEDQVMAMTQLGIRAVALHSANTDTSAAGQAWKGQYSVVYMTPERVVLSVPQIATMWEQGKLGRIAIDEAHCVSEWGHDFRKEYRELHVLRERCPQVPLIALTATATGSVQQDIVRQTRLNNPLIVKTGFDRPNLSYAVRAKRTIAADFSRSLIGTGSVIVYCNKITTTEEIAAHLRTLGVQAAAYHGKLEHSVRMQVHRGFVTDQLQVVVATTSFGMGVDKADVYAVIHYGLQKSLEEYMQQSGRAGRNGMPSRCVLFTDAKEKSRGLYFAKQSEKDGTHPNAMVLFKGMNSFVETNQCRRRVLLEYFGEVLANDCQNCDNCNSGSSTAATAAAAAAPGVVLSEDETKMFDWLRVWRLGRAKTLNIAPYMLMSDRTLQELSVKRPASVQALHSVFGLAKAKITQHGADVVAEVQRLATLLSLPPVATTASSGSSSTSGKRKAVSSGSCSGTVMQTWDLHDKQGKHADEIAVTRGIKVNTVVDHLLQYLDAHPGATLNWSLVNVVPEALEQPIACAIRAQPDKVWTVRGLEQVARSSGASNSGNGIDWALLQHCKLLKHKYCTKQ